MKITCPLCSLAQEAEVKLASGPIFNSFGYPVLGEMDELAGRVYSPNTQHWLRAHFRLNSNSFSIFECINCRKELVVARNPDRVVWPLGEATVAAELPDQIKKMHIEAKKAHAVGAETAALLAARTALVRMLRDQHTSSFKELYESQKITGLLWGQADEIRLWANVLSHEDVPDELDPEDVTELLTYLDQIFHTLYVQPRQLEDMRLRRPRP